VAQKKINYILAFIAAIALIFFSFRFLQSDKQSITSPSRIDESSAGYELESVIPTDTPAIVNQASSNRDSLVPDQLLQTEATQFLPVDLIASHLDEAMAGNRDSGYLLWRVQRYCNGLPSSQSALEEILNNPEMAEYLKVREQKRYPLCTRAASKFPHFFENDMFSLADIRADKHPLYLLLFKKQPREERVELINQVLSNEVTHNFFISEALVAATNLYRVYPGYEDEFRATAISFTACKYDFFCDQEGLAKTAKHFYPPNKFQEYLDLAEKIDKGLVKNDFKDLGF